MRGEIVLARKVRLYIFIDAWGLWELRWLSIQKASLHVTWAEAVPSVAVLFLLCYPSQLPEEHWEALVSLECSSGLLMGHAHDLSISCSGNSSRLWSIWGKNRKKPGNWKSVRRNRLPSGRQVALEKGAHSHHPSHLWGRVRAFSLPLPKAT